MSVVRDILELMHRPAVSGKKAPPAPGIPELETAIRQLQAERSVAEQAIRDMPIERERLLEEDGTDDAIRALEDATDRRHLLVERLDRLERPLFERLNALRSEQRSAQWRELRARYLEAADGYASALLALLPHLDRMSAVAAEMQTAGFHAEAQARPCVPWAGRAMQVEDYRLALDRYATLGARRPHAAANVPRTMECRLGHRRLQPAGERRHTRRRAGRNRDGAGLMFIDGFLALCSVVDAGSCTETAATGYARQAISFSDPVNGISFSAPTYSFGAMASLAGLAGRAVFDAPTGGNLLLVLPFPQPLSGWRPL